MEYTEANLKKLKVNELKAELSKHSLAVTGKKEDLISRLLTFSKKNQSAPNSAVDTAKHVVTVATVSKPTSPSTATLSSPKKVSPVPQISTSVPPVSSNLLSPTASAVAKTDEERLKERAKRFGLPEPVQVAKKPKVADATAIQSPKSPHKTVSNANTNAGILKNESADILKKRQERFGIINPNVEKVIKMTEEDELKRKRLERFGPQEHGKK